MRKFRFAAAIGACAVVSVALLAAAAPPADGRNRGILASLEPGLWQLRNLADPRARLPSLCIGDPSLLLHVQHGAGPCRGEMLEAGASELTVRYSCGQRGIGRTTLSLETPRLVRIDTQGMEGGVPFAFRAEARRVGACPG